MPAHTLPFTFADGMSFVTAALYMYQPGVDRKAVMQWLHDNIFGDSKTMAVWGILLLHKIFEWGVIGVYSLLYWLELPIFERHRTFPHKPWPWKNPNPKVREEFYTLRKTALIYIVKFHCVVVFINWLIGKGVAATPDFDVEHSFGVDTVPHWWTSCWQTIAGTIVAETGFYWAHRLEHQPWLYWAHKWHHEFKDCSIYATFYVHPLDALLTDIIPAGLPLMLFDMHIYTVYMYTIPLILNAGWVHCGYELPFRFNPLLFLPMSTASETTHDIHHRCYRYNFGGAYFVWDRLMGTYRPPPPLDCEPKLALKHLATLGQYQPGHPTESSSIDAVVPPENKVD